MLIKNPDNNKRPVHIYGFSFVAFVGFLIFLQIIKLLIINELILLYITGDVVYETQQMNIICC
jgi:hypothetical protein